MLAIYPPSGFFSRVDRSICRRQPFFFLIARACIFLWMAFFCVSAMATTVSFSGNVRFSVSGNTAVLTADKIINTSAGGTSGTLRMELWAFASPYSSGQSGYKLAQYTLPATLGPGASYNDVSSGSVAYAGPPNGTWYYSMVLTEYSGTGSNDGFGLVSFVNLSPAVVAGARFNGQVGYSSNGNSVVLSATQIANSAASRPSGTLRLELWAFSSPFSGSQSGYKLAEYTVGTLSNGFVFNNLSSGSVPYLLPPNGVWYYALLLTEYTGAGTNDGFVVDDHADFTNPVSIGTGAVVPACTVTANPTSVPSSGGVVTVQAACSGSPTSYSWSVNGGAVSATTASWSYSVPANSSTSARVYTFTTIARNSAGPSSAASASISQAGVTQSGSGVNLNQHGLTGSWFNAATGGQGIEMEIYPDLGSPGNGLLFAGWFTYDVTAAGGQRWYALEGGVSSSSPVAQLGIYGGLGGNFDAQPSIAATQEGNATIQFSDCTHGTLTYAFYDGRTGTIPLTRITANVTCSAAGDNGNAASDFLLSGSWFDTSMGGQGLVFDINPIQDVFFAAWYTYAPHGQQIGGAASERWYVLQTAMTPGAAALSNVPIYTDRGGIFNNPTAPTPTQVGSANITFHNCASATLQYTFTSGDNAGLSGTLDLIRTGPTPKGCAL